MKFEIQLASILVFFGYSLHEHKYSSSLTERQLKPSLNDDLLTLYIALYRGLVYSIIDLNRDHVLFTGNALNNDLSSYCEKTQSIFSVHADDVSAEMSPSGYRVTYGYDIDEIVKEFSNSLLVNTFQLAFTNYTPFKQNQINNLLYLRNFCSDYSNPLKFSNVQKRFDCLYNFNNEDKEINLIKKFGKILGYAIIKITPRAVWYSYFEEESESNLRPIVFAQFDLQTITKLTLKFLSTDDYNEREKLFTTLLESSVDFELKNG